MSVLTGVEKAPLQFFRSSPAPCPYLPGRIERKLFARLPPSEAISVNSTLSRAGFRRSHDMIYKPVCPGCAACVAVRVPVASFVPSDSLKRLARRGRDLVARLGPPQPDRELYALFIRYEKARHPESDMARMSYDDFSAMMTEGQADSALLTLSRAPSTGGYAAPLGVMLADRLTDGWSAVYSFYEPDAGEADVPSSLGTLLILRMIANVQAENLPYLYLGYWVENSRKMDYKARFRPLEALGPAGWQKMTGGESIL